MNQTNTVPVPRFRTCLCALLLSGLLAYSSLGWAQQKTTNPKAIDAASTPNAEPQKDPLGRTSPRGAVLGFINAARKGNAEVAVLYLNTSLRGEPAQNLAHQLAIVLDR